MAITEELLDQLIKDYKKPENLIIIDRLQPLSDTMIRFLNR